MTDSELKKELAKILPNYKFSKTTLIESIFGIKDVESKTFRDENKALIKTGSSRHIFISSVMYPNTPNSFRYAINSTKNEKRKYRHKYFNEYSYNKIFLSAKTDEELLQKIKESFT